MNELKSDNSLIKDSKPLDQTTLLTITYLTTPNILLLTKWFTPEISTPLCALILTSIIKLFRKIKITTTPNELTIIALAFSLIWTSLGGAGHFFYANPDWTVRDAVYGDLILSEWPIAYGMNNGNFLILRSAIGYFLPPAALTKQIGIEYANLVLYLWSAIGVFLFIKLIPAQDKRVPKFVIAILTIILFSGMDIVGIIIKTGQPPMFPLRMEWWVPFSYTSLSGQLFWAPNHTIPIWLATALIIRHWKSESLISMLTILIPILAIWTPFAPMGILPIATLAAYEQKAWKKLNEIDKLLTITAIALSAIVLMFLTLSSNEIPSFPSIRNDTIHRKSLEAFLLDYALFCLMEFGIITLIISKNISKDDTKILTTSAITLLALPLYLFGPSNDSLLRLSVPPLITIAFLSAKLMEKIISAKEQVKLKSLFLMVFVFGSATPFFEIFRAITWQQKKPDYSITFPETQNGNLPKHYVGELNNKLLESILKEPHLLKKRKIEFN